MIVDFRIEPLLDDLLSDRETMFDGFSKRSQRLRGTTPDKDALEIHFELLRAKKLVVDAHLDASAPDLKKTSHLHGN